MIILQPVTTEAQSLGFEISIEGQSISVFCKGLSGTEKATIQRLDEIQGWGDYYFNGVNPYFDANSEHIIVKESARYKVNKPVTITAVGVSVASVKQIIVE